MKAKLEGVVEINKEEIAVGAIKNAFFPFVMDGIALLCGSVGT